MALAAHENVFLCVLGECSLFSCRKEGIRAGLKKTRVNGHNKSHWRLGDIAQLVLPLQYYCFVSVCRSIKNNNLDLISLDVI